MKVETGDTIKCWIPRKGLTKKKNYKILGVVGEKVTVENDDGDEKMYSKHIFVKG